MMILFLTTSLGKKLILPMFQLDALVLLRVTQQLVETLDKITVIPNEAVKKRTFHHFMT